MLPTCLPRLVLIWSFFPLKSPIYKQVCFFFLSLRMQEAYQFYVRQIAEEEYIKPGIFPSSLIVKVSLARLSIYSLVLFKYGSFSHTHTRAMVIMLAVNIAIIQGREEAHKCGSPQKYFKILRGKNKALQLKSTLLTERCIYLDF